jgi:hypothetical protein
MDDDGNAIAIWRFGLELHMRRYVPGNGWSALETLFPTANQPVIETGQVAVASNGRAVVARIQATEVVVRRFDPATGWEDGEPLGATGSLFVVRAGIDDAGNVLVTWKNSAAWFWRRYDAATDTWEAIQTLLADTTPNFLGALYDAQLLVLPNGNAIAAAQQSDGGLQRVWTARFDGTQKTWTVPEALVSTVTCSFMIASAADGAVAYGAWLTCINQEAAVAWKKYTTASGWSADATPIPPQNSLDSAGAVGVPLVHVAVAPDDSGLLILRRNHNADNAILAAKLQ